HIWTSYYENPMHSGIMIRRDVALEHIDRSAHRAYEDWAACLRLTFAGTVCHMLPITTYNYRKSGVTRSSRHAELHNEALKTIRVSAAPSLREAGNGHMGRVSVIISDYVNSIGENVSGPAEPRVQLRFRLIDKIY